MKIKYKLEELCPGIYHVTIKDAYDLAMTFCRVQEFYESPYKEIKGKLFKMFDLMSIYSKRRHDGCFTYPIDWCGFNIPGYVVEQLYSQKIPDLNGYDKIILAVRNKIKRKYKSAYYLIASQGDKETIEHEICHGIYATRVDYRIAANKIINKISKPTYKVATDVLKELGYTKEVWMDEVHAYLATEYELIKDHLKTKKQRAELAVASAELKMLKKSYFKDLKI